MNLWIYLIIFIISLVIFIGLRSFLQNDTHTILNICYLVFISILQFFLNMELSKYVCGFYDLSTIFLVTFLPWLIIMGSMFFLLKFFPKWINPFANTFGTLFTSFPVNMYALFNNDQLISKKESILNFINLNDNNVENISKFVNENNISINDPETNSNIDLIPYITNIINFKIDVSLFTWYTLSLILLVGISVSSIFTSSCKMSVKEMKKRNSENR